MPVKRLYEQSKQALDSSPPIIIPGARLNPELANTTHFTHPDVTSSEESEHQEDHSKEEEDEFTGLDPNSYLRMSFFISYAREHRQIGRAHV